MKFYYENSLASQNYTAKPNIAWCADITEVQLDENKKLFVFLCVDIHTNFCIAHSSSQKTFTSHAIIKCLSKAIDKRFSIKPKRKVILHTDRGTQFSSQAYRNFTLQYKEFMTPSMSRPNTPTDNGVAERYMRTFKEHKVNGKVFEQIVQESFLSGSKSYRRTVNIFIKSVNSRPNKKSLLKSPARHDTDVIVASTLMNEPLYSKAYSEQLRDDYRRHEIDHFKSQRHKVTSILEQLAAQKAELVDYTPFDLDDSKALQLIDQRLMQLYELIQTNPVLIQKYVENAVEPVGENVQELQEEFREEMEIINSKLDMLLPKAKKDRKTQPLRDPIDNGLYPIFLTNAGDVFQRKKDLKRAQLRITYTILFYCGLRINEIRHLTQEDLKRAISASQLSLIHHKTNQAHIHVLSKKAVQDLIELNAEFYIIFDKYQYQYLFGKTKPINHKSLISIVNKDLKQTSSKYSIPFNIKSHSFRVNIITNLLKITSVQNTASIMGHSDIRSTMSYNRYALSKSQIQELLDQIDDTL
jgi:transposase InsO family protein